MVGARINNNKKKEKTRVHCLHFKLLLTLNHFVSIIYFDNYSVVSLSINAAKVENTYILNIDVINKRQKAEITKKY